MSDNKNETMTPNEIAKAVQEHGGDPSMTLGASLDALIGQGKIKVATKPSKTAKAVATPAMTPKFSFEKPVAFPTVQKFLSKEEQEQKLAAEREKKAAKTKALEEFTSQIGPWMPDLVIALRAYSEMTEEAQELSENKEREQANQKMMAEALNQEDPDAQAVAVKAFAASYVLTCPKRKKDVQDVVGRLINYDLLAKTDRRGDGVCLVYDGGIELAPKFRDDLQAKEIFRDLKNLVRETKENGREFFRGLEETFEAKNTDPISIDNLLAMVYEDHAEKKSGTIVLENPAHEERGRDGEVRSYRGGKILYGVNDNKMYCIDGLGGTQRVAQNLADAGTFVFLNQLREERVRFSENMSEGARKGVGLLHKLIRIGIRTMREKAEKAAAEQAAAEAKKAEEAKYAEERLDLIIATPTESFVANEEFFLEGKPGAILLDNLADPWIRRSKGTDGKPIETAYPHARNALVIRQDDGKILVKCPTRLASLFQGAQEAAHPGDKFSRLEYPLGLMLRIMWGITKQTKNEADRKVKEAEENKLTAVDMTETGTEAQ